MAREERTRRDMGRLWTGELHGDYQMKVKMLTTLLRLKLISRYGQEYSENDYRLVCW